MSVRHVTTAAGALLAAFWLGVIATPAVAGVAAQPAPVDPYVLTPGRLLGTVASLVAMAGVILGGLALARPAGRLGGGRGAIAALVAGPAGMAAGGVVVALAKGGPGTGYGIVGGVAALAIGLVATAIGALARARARRTPAGSGSHRTG